MVIHPAYENRRSEIDQLDGVEANWKTPFFNSNMEGFPKRLNEGKGANTFGIAISVRDPDALAGLLAVLSAGERGATVELSAEESDIENARTDLDVVPQTTRVGLIEARRGQGRFRDDLFRYWESCAVSGLAISPLLRASHIKPWRDSTNAERLDPFNGLLLSAGLDAAFDGGYISFEDGGRILICPQFESSCHVFGITATMTLRRVDRRHQAYLRWHRSSVFVG